MKRLIVFILLIFLLSCFNLQILKNADIKSLFYNSKIEIYYSEIIDIQGIKTMPNGTGTIAFSNIDNLNDLLSLHNVVGYTIKIKNNNIDDALKKIKPNYYKKTKEYIYGLSGKFKRFKCVNGYNFQIAKCGDEVLVGIPILLGSY